MQRVGNNYKLKLTYSDMAGAHTVLIVLGGLDVCMVWEEIRDRGLPVGA